MLVSKFSCLKQQQIKLKKLTGIVLAGVDLVDA